MEQNSKVNASSFVQDEKAWMDCTAVFRNCQTTVSSSIPTISEQTFRWSLISAFQEGYAISALYAVPDSTGAIQVSAVLSCSSTAQLRICRCILQDTQWKSLVNQIPAVHLFEREMAEQQGIVLNGHPWPKPVRHSGNKAAESPLLLAQTDFCRIEGSEIHEVAVGPVHAGIIEPGHFRFQCYGEEVFHLDIALGYQHRGIESRLCVGPDVKTMYYIENIAGDTAVANAIAYCQALESLSGSSIPPRAEALRGIALELERLANHTGDLGALAQDIGYLPTSAYCGRLRGDFLNLTALLCGSRFGRGLIRPGGVLYDVDQARIEEFTKKFQDTIKDVENAVSLLWDTPSVLARFEGTGKLSLNCARDLGLVGPAARACGLARDTRHDFPSGIYQFYHLPIATFHSGDVFARAYVRWMEIQRSSAFILELLRSLPQGAIRTEIGKVRPGQLIVSLVEGWRGEVCHIGETNEYGFFTYYKVIDPSFHNWTGLAFALRNQQISDFPLCNKSFNLSYCGHDL